MNNVRQKLFNPVPAAGSGGGGEPGAPGLSAYEVAVANGFVGNQAAWLASLQGEDGEDGEGGGLPTSNNGQVFQNQDGTVVATATLNDTEGESVMSIENRTLHNNQGAAIFEFNNAGTADNPPALPIGISIEKFLGFTSGSINDVEAGQIYDLQQVYNVFLLSEEVENFDVKGFTNHAITIGQTGLIYIRNENANGTLTLKHLAAGVDAEEQIVTQNGRDLVLGIGDVVFLMWTNKFQVIFTNQVNKSGYYVPSVVNVIGTFSATNTVKALYHVSGSICTVTIKLEDETLQGDISNAFSILFQPPPGLAINSPDSFRGTGYLIAVNNKAALSAQRTFVEYSTSPAGIGLYITDLDSMGVTGTFIIHLSYQV